LIGVFMKKAWFLVPGTLALILAATPMISGFNNPAIADEAQTGEWHHGGFWQKLNLTDDQKAQIKQIRDSAKQQLDTVFTADQKAQLQQARTQHIKPTLNLTDDQKAQLKQIHSSIESQINAVLTPEQQQQLQQLRSQHNQRHLQHSS
jgi:protein CpxP